MRIWVRSLEYSMKILMRHIVDSEQPMQHSVSLYISKIHIMTVSTAYCSMRHARLSTISVNMFWRRYLLESMQTTRILYCPSQNSHTNWYLYVQHYISSQLNISQTIPVDLIIIIMSGSCTQNQQLNPWYISHLDLLQDLSSSVTAVLLLIDFSSLDAFKIFWKGNQ